MKKSGPTSPRRARTKSFTEPEPGLQKHRQVFNQLYEAIQSGKYRAQDRLPSEADLGKTFSASRITVAKAVNELQRLGMVSRRAGSGTYVLPKASTANLVFGLLIPDLGRTEIFEPICQGMMRSSLSSSHSLLSGPAMGRSDEVEHEAEQLCQHYISQKVSGVFFAPLELSPGKDILNRRIVQLLDEASIPVVLLDRCFENYPDRSKFDLVGIDNRRTGYHLARHLIQLGARRIAVVAMPYSAPTVDARIAGYREALYTFGVQTESDLVFRGSPEDPVFVRTLLSQGAPEAVVCANDLTAARLMQTLTELGVRIPEELRLVAVDDVKYAGLLPVPLTSIHQNCAEIGAIALATMLERIERPNLPTRDILLQTSLVIRNSCGSHLGPIRH
jgi:DNA-binding LacI/PurR family transcriptional regulator